METQNKVFLAAMGWLAFFAIGLGFNLAMLRNEGWELSPMRKIFLLFPTLGILAIILQLILFSVAMAKQKNN